MTKSQHGRESSKALERPPLSEGETYVVDVPADILDRPAWKSGQGRLLITNLRVIYLTAVPWLRPRAVFGSPPISFDLNTIVNIDAKRSLRTVIFTSGLAGFQLLLIRTNDGRMLRFHVWDALAIKQEIERILGSA